MSSVSAGVGGGLPPQTSDLAGYGLQTDGQNASWVSVAAGGVTSLAAVGSSPNANGGSISSQTLTLQPADATHPGVLTTGVQSIGGVKTFTASSLVTGGSGSSVTLGTFGGITGLWGASGSLAGPSGTNWTLAEYNDEAYLASAGTSAANIHFRIKTVDCMLMSATTLDMTGFGAGGSIKLKSPNGTTFTATISNAGAWVIA